MHDPDRIYFSNFAVDPEFESIYEYDDLYDMDFEPGPDHGAEKSSYDDSDEFEWDLL